VTGLLVRFAKRKAAWETPDPAKIREVEFKDKNGQYDLRPSMYDVAEEQIVQAFAEHAAAAPIDPPGSALGIDFSGVRFKVEAELGSDKFSFTRDRHREVVLSSTSELDEVIELACREFEKRRRDIAKASVFKYVSERLAANDKEWTDLLESPDAKGWLKTLATKRKTVAK
jgi:hypothetical protein